MTVWKGVCGGWLYGIAKSHYDQEIPKHLSLTTGDAIIIKSECEHWYYGYKKDDRHQQGIFPKTYVAILDCVKYHDGYREVYKIPRSTIVEEITTVLKEWRNHLLDFYLTNQQNFPVLKDKMLSLIKLRQQLLSSSLPTDEIRELKLKATNEIDTGNSMLSLDMVVRDDAGDLIDFGSISTTQLYELHCKAVNRIMQNTETKTSKRNSALKPMTTITHNFLITVNSIMGRFTDDMECLFTLYSMETEILSPLTENYVVHLMKEEQLSEVKLLFTDLTTEDLNYSKIFLIVYLVRVGAMEVEGPKHQKLLFPVVSRRQSTASLNSLQSMSQLRRPFGVAFLDLTPIINKPNCFDNSKNMTVFPCEKECLDVFLRRMLNNRDNREPPNIERNINVTVEMLHGDIKQIKEDYIHIVRNMSFARKMGFPEVILPGDVRNDLYLTLVQAELSKASKRGETNIEIQLTVCTDDGNEVKSAISKGGGTMLENAYRSVIYTHDEKPKWYETIKIELPIEEFRRCHVKFLFRHRSSTDAKDKVTKPFALSFMKLLHNNGTALQQGEQVMAVYKIDKKADVEALTKRYFSLPSTYQDAVASGAEKHNIPGLAFSPKDSFTVKTNLCSTKLTQDVKLLSLLNWQSNPDELEQSLKNLMTVEEAEMVKFLQDILDVLFNAFDKNPSCNQLIFSCILRLIEIVSNPKYKNFESVLDSYIKEGFSATLAYKTLSELLHKNIFDTVYHKDSDSNLVASHDNKLYKIVKHLPYIMKFIIRSRELYLNCCPNSDQSEFNSIIEYLLLAFNQLISSNEKDRPLLKSKGAVLKFLHVIASDLLPVYDPIKLSKSLEGIINCIPFGHLSQSKMIAIKDLVESQVFCLTQCRAILLPVFCKQIIERLENNEETDMRKDLAQNIQDQENQQRKIIKFFGASLKDIGARPAIVESKMKECINILNNVLKNLSRTDIGGVDHDIKTIMNSLLRTIIQSIIVMSDENPLKGNLVAIMLGIFHHMRSEHYRIYVQALPSKLDKQDFLTEILCVFATLVQKPVFPHDWFDMIMHQNTVILESLRHFSVIIMEHFYTKGNDNEVTFVKDVWSIFFHCATNFLVQPSLQLDKFTANKKSVIVKRYRDIRRETAVEVRRMWFNLGEYKTHFIPELVGPILEMSMLPDDEIRRASIPIFPDMMISEFLSSKFVPESYGDTRRNPSHCKGNFNDFETEIIKKLDALIQRGDGDEAYKQTFEVMMNAACKKHVNLTEDGVSFVKKATTLMGKLLEYRNALSESAIDNLMACTVQLLQFYAGTMHTDMYVKYVNKLYKLHEKCDNYTEAAYTLKLITDLLKWDDTICSTSLACDIITSTSCTHRELKENLYKKIILLFDKGKMWETALEICKELVEQYEKETYNYRELSALHEKMSEFYRKILNTYKDPKTGDAVFRQDYAYYRVGFFGQGFPEWLRNKEFVYRGAECEKLESFTTRLQDQHPKAELLRDLETPGPEKQNANAQYIQVVTVRPVPSDLLKTLEEKFVDTTITSFHKYNNVQVFELQRPIVLEGYDRDDIKALWITRILMKTISPLPGILTSSLINKVDIIKLSPIQNAISTMETTNRDLRELIVKYTSNPNLGVSQLCMKLQGVIDAPVMGGLKKYEEAFLTPEYEANNPIDYSYIKQLKESIANQMPLLQNLLMIQKDILASQDDNYYKSLHQNLEEKFKKMQEDVEQKYGKRTTDFEQMVVLRRPNTVSIPLANRQSDTSVGSGDSDKPSRLRIPPFFVTNTMKPKKDKNRQKKLSTDSTDQRSTQFYTSLYDDAKSVSSLQSPPTAGTSSNLITTGSNSNSCIELFQPLTPQRPLRPDHEKRLSRPPSTFTNGSTISFDPNITEMSGDETDESVPPPLPVKNRDSDYYGSLNMLPSDNNSNRSSGESTEMASVASNEPLYAPVYNSSYDTVNLIGSRPISTQESMNNFITDLLDNEANQKRPPTPPPKPSRSRRSTPSKTKDIPEDNNDKNNNN